MLSTRELGQFGFGIDRVETPYLFELFSGHACFDMSDCNYLVSSSI